MKPVTILTEPKLVETFTTPGGKVGFVWEDDTKRIIVYRTVAEVAKNTKLNEAAVMKSVEGEMGRDLAQNIEDKMMGLALGLKPFGILQSNRPFANPLQQSGSLFGMRLGIS